MFVTGKTTVIKAMIEFHMTRGVICVPMATSGIAANLLPGGRTVHYRLHAPIKISEESLLNIKNNSPVAELVRQATIFFIDEITMAHKHLVECIDRSFRDLRECPDKPFGGAIMIFSGDWMQCLPVVPMARRAEITYSTVKASYIWSQVQEFKLKTNMRILTAGEENKQYAKYLLDIGEGKEEIYPEHGEFAIKLPDKLKSKSKSLKEFALEVFDGIKEKVKHGIANQLVQEDWDNFKKWMVQRAIICPKNEDVEEVNKIIMDEIDTQAHIYRSADKLMHEEQGSRYTQEFLNGLTPASVPPHILILKEGSMIMLIRNLDPQRGHVNGARYIVRSLRSKVILAELAEGPYNGNQIAIPRILFNPEDPKIPIEWSRKQFPVKGCPAITSNKSQGQTLKKIGIYLKNDFFGHGQLYVAMSRVGNPKCISFYKPPPITDDKKKRIDPNQPLFVSNVVFKEVLS